MKKGLSLKFFFSLIAIPNKPRSSFILGLLGVISKSGLSRTVPLTTLFTLPVFFQVLKNHQDPKIP